MSTWLTVSAGTRILPAFVLVAATLSVVGCHKNVPATEANAADAGPKRDDNSIKAPVPPKKPAEPHRIHPADVHFPLDDYDAIQKWMESWNVKISLERANELSLREKKYEFQSECKELEGKTVQWRIDILSVRSLPGNKACIEVVNRGIRVVWLNKDNQKKDEVSCPGFQVPATQDVKDIGLRSRLIVKGKIVKSTCDWYMRGLEFPKLSLDLLVEDFSFEKPRDEQ